MATVAARELVSVDPATLEVVGRVPALEPEAVAELVDDARRAQERWAETPPVERRALLERVLWVLLERMDEIAETATAETGKPIVEAYAHEVLVAVEHTRWLARHAERVLRDERLPRPALYLPQKRLRIVHEPLGVVAVIGPWNVPFSLPFAQAAAVVAAGNSCVVKPSEVTPLCGEWIGRVFAEAGAPPGLVLVAQGGADVGAALVDAPAVAKVIFTGGAEAGRAVARAAAERLIPVTLELSGKDPMLVLGDADLHRPVDRAPLGSFAHCGQVCAGIERIYVDRALYEPFVEELARRARSLRVGNGRDTATDVGPLATEEARERVEALVADAVARGADVRAGGRRPDVGLPGWFHEPTVLTGTEIRNDELFGPVVTVAPFAGDDEAARLANDSEFGLSASVWTRDEERFARLARRIDAGSVWMNDTAYSYATPAPWGGRKGSGFGTTHGKYGLLDVTRPKLVDADGGRLRAPWWYPYGEDGVEGFRALARGLYGRDAGARARALWEGRGALLSLGRRYLR